MSTALERLTAGYYNNGLRSAANPGGLSGTGALRINWPLLQADIAEVAGGIATSHAEAAAYAASALGAPGTNATSVTNMAIPGALPAVINFDLVQAGKLFTKGQSVVVSDDADPTNQFIGQILAFDPITKAMSVRALQAAGAGAHALWNIALSSPVDGTLTGRVLGIEGQLSRDAGRARLFNKDI